MSKKILIVDDDQLNTALVKFGLSEKRYEVITAEDGEEGLKVMKEENPDLIVLDVQMPNMNGYEFMTELKGMPEYNSISVIMLTANETMEDVFKLEGVSGYFVKPVNLQDLVEKVKECIGLPEDDL